MLSFRGLFTIKGVADEWADEVAVGHTDLVVLVEQCPGFIADLLAHGEERWLLEAEDIAVVGMSLNESAHVAVFGLYCVPVFSVQSSLALSVWEGAIIPEHSV